MDMEIVQTATSFVFGVRNKTPCGHSDTYLIVHYILFALVDGFDRAVLTQCPLCQATWES